MTEQTKERACRVCGCTQESPCMVRVKPHGLASRWMPCRWREADLCSDPRCVLLGTHVQVSQDEMHAIALLLSKKPLTRAFKMMMRGIRRREMKINRRAA